MPATQPTEGTVCSPSKKLTVQVKFLPGLNHCENETLSLLVMR